MKSVRLVLAAVLAAWSLGAAALPSVEQVQAEVRQGHYAQAETMMAEVVAARPDSARAHYVYAEVLAHNRRFADATREVAAARRIDPALKFTDPATFKAFEAQLERETQAARTPSTGSLSAPPAAVRSAPEPRSGGGVPGYVWALGLAAVAALVFVSLRRRAVAMPPQPMAYGSGVGPIGTPAGSSPGSGLLGVGLAAAGGVAAGMLAEKMLEGRRERHDDGDASAGSGYVPGMFDDARDDGQRAIDFGTGDGWGGGDSGGGSDGGGDGGGW